MKLLFCLFHYFPYGGLQRDCVALAKTALAKGHQVTILCNEWQGDKIENIPVITLGLNAFSNHKKVDKMIAAFQAFFAQHSFDLIIGFNRIPGVDIYYAADYCYQDYYQGLPWYKKIWPRYRYFLKQEKSLCENTNTHFFLLTPNECEKFKKHYGISAERLHILPLGLDADHYPLEDDDETKQIALKKQYGLVEKDKLILFVASGFKTKGLDRALEAIASLPKALQQSVHFWIVGRGDPAPYQALAKKIPQVSFLSGRDDVPTLMRAADLLLHPARAENAGNVLIEAMASGLPILTTDICGYAPYIVAANAGVVIPSFSQDELNKQLFVLLSTDNTPYRHNGIAFCRDKNVHARQALLIQQLEQMGGVL